jgi:uncharacterized protein YgbK (DUF1537 family)
MGGVNITVGLPIIRTSVDHGTGFGRAGSGRAEHGSLLAAIDAAHRLIAGRRAAFPRYILVADDLTGANDTGVQLLNHSLAASVSIEKGDSSSPDVMPAGAQALVFDTESRNIPAQDAARRVSALSGALARFAGQSVFYKKVDSTLRGNLGAEIRALADGLGLRTVVFTSAFPRNGRIVRDNVLYLDNVPVAETAMARDPFKPVLTSRPTEILAEAYPEARPLTLPTLRDPKALAAALAAAPATGACFCCDAENEDDLLALVRGVLETRPAKDVLWSGSAGLAGALLAASGERPEPLPAPAKAASAAPVLLVLGSVHPKNREQARRVLNAGEAAPASLDMQTFLANPETESARLLSECSALLASGRNVLLSTSRSEDDIRQGKSDAVADFVAGVVRKLLTTVPVRGLFMTGGDIAVRVLAALECRTARIEREVELGVPLVRLQGGLCSGLAVITKAGAFGNDETLRHCLAEL